ncbi:MAG: hypothetical protein V2A76_15550 [Planctomycetota bacterium]
MKRIEISTPKEGAETLVAQISVLEILDVLKKIAALEGGDPSPREIEHFLDEECEGMNAGMRKKLELMARGLTPPDDFQADDCCWLSKRNPRTLEVAFHQERTDLVPGDLIFHAGERWLYVNLAGDKLILKRV